MNAAAQNQITREGLTTFAGSMGHRTWGSCSKAPVTSSDYAVSYTTGDGGLSNAVPNRKEDSMVWVNPYYRIRFGKLEHVCGHFRSHPA